MVCFPVLSGPATVGGGGRAHRAVAGCRSSDERCGVCYGHLTGEGFFSALYFSEMREEKMTWEISSDCFCCDRSLVNAVELITR